MRATFAALPRLAHFGMTRPRGGQERDRVGEAGASSRSTSRDWNDIFAESTELRIEGARCPARR